MWLFYFVQAETLMFKIIILPNTTAIRNILRILKNTKLTFRAATTVYYLDIHVDIHARLLSKIDL